MENTRLSHLEELKGSDFQIVDDMPDIQGWKIEDYNGEKIGKVKDMLFDKNARKVRYIITKLENIGDDQEVLIPIGKAQLLVSDKKVVIPNFTAKQLSRLPIYIKGDLTSQDEYAIRNAFRTSSGELRTENVNSPYSSDTFYDEDDFNEDRFYNRGDYATRSDDLGNANSVGDMTGLDRTDEVDKTGNLNDRRNTYRADDDPIEGDVNNPNKL